MKKKLDLPFQKVDLKKFGIKKYQNNFFTIRFYLFILLTLFVFLIMISRLFVLTIVKGSLYQYISEKNRYKNEIISAKRGTIFDRKGIVLASQSLDNSEIRSYPFSESFAHFIGYRQIADENDIKNDICLNTISNIQKIGKQGIEKVFECVLRGKNGSKITENNSQGTSVKDVYLNNPINGKDIFVSLDSEIQNIAYDQIKDKKAAVIATKPQTGEILIFTSSPSFDPSYFELNNQEKINQYLKEETKPLFSRVNKGTYPPGSVFKITVATGALEDKYIDENLEIEDTGKIKAGPLEFGNWYFLQYGKVEGPVNIIKSLQRSNDIFYYKIGEKLGVEGIKKWAEKFGFGNNTGLILGDESGIIPSKFWKEENIKEKWYLGDTYNLSIGQGYLMTSPIQVNLSTQIIANKGKLCKPKTIKFGSNNYGDELIKQESTPECINLNISQKTINIVKEGMKKACETGGTAWPFFDFKPQVACKTGTAESYSEKHMPHAWFTVFAPLENPEIVLTVLVEEAGEGSDMASPIAKEILKTYFKNY